MVMSSGPAIETECHFVLAKAAPSLTDSAASDAIALPPLYSVNLTPHLSILPLGGTKAYRQDARFDCDNVHYYQLYSAGVRHGFPSLCAVVEVLPVRVELSGAVVIEPLSRRVDQTQTTGSPSRALELPSLIQTAQGTTRGSESRLSLPASARGAPPKPSQRSWVVAWSRRTTTD